MSKQRNEKASSLLETKSVPTVAKQYAVFLHFLEIWDSDSVEGFYRGAKVRRFNKNVRLSFKFEEMLEELQTHRISQVGRDLQGTIWEQQKHCLSYQPDPQLSKLHMLKELLNSLNLSKMMRYIFVVHKNQTRFLNLKVFLIDFLYLSTQFLKSEVAGRMSVWKVTRWRITLTFFAVMSDSVPLYFIKPQDIPFHLHRIFKMNIL